MTFRRWARLLIGVIMADDFMVCTVEADSKGEATLQQLKTHFAEHYRQQAMKGIIDKTITRAVIVSLASKIQSSGSVRL